MRRCPIFTNILIPTDGSELSQKAVNAGIDLAKALQARITALHVVVPAPVYPLEMGMMPPLGERVEENIEKALQAAGETYLDHICMAAAAAGLVCDRLLVKNNNAGKGIVETAQMKRCDLIIMGAHRRRGLSALMLGSETNEVLSHSKIPVLVYR